MTGRRQDAPTAIAIESLLPRVPGGGSADQPGSSGAFKVVDDRDRVWWAKSLDNLQSERATLADAIIGSVAPLIEAPVCTAAILEYPQGRSAVEMANGVTLEPGYYHGSLEVGSALDSWEVEHSTRDDNERRWTRMAALWDWCWGGDAQWLYAQTHDYMLYSHDHGHYLPGVDHDWTVDDLRRDVHQPHVLTKAQHILRSNQEYCASVATALRNVTHEQLANALATLPATWRVTDEELDYVGWFLDERREDVAKRLEQPVTTKEVEAWDISTP